MNKMADFEGVGREVADAVTQDNQSLRRFPRAGAIAVGIDRLRFVEHRVEALQRDQLLAVAHAHQGDALRVAADLRDFRRARAHQRALVGNKQDLVLFGELDRPDQRAIARARASAITPWVPRPLRG